VVGHAPTTVLIRRQATRRSFEPPMFSGPYFNCNYMPIFGNEETRKSMENINNRDASQYGDQYFIRNAVFVTRVHINGP